MRVKKGVAPKYNLIENYEGENENLPYHYKVVDKYCNVVAEFRNKEKIEAVTIDLSFKFRNKNFVFRRRHSQEIRKAQEAINRKRFLELTTIVTSNEVIVCTGLFD